MEPRVEVMSRRSRTSKPKLADVAPGVLKSLTSLVEGNEATITSMLQIDEGASHDGDVM